MCVYVCCAAITFKERWRCCGHVNLNGGNLLSDTLYSFSHLLLYHSSSAHYFFLSLLPVFLWLHFLFCCIEIVCYVNTHVDNMQIFTGYKAQVSHISVSVSWRKGFSTMLLCSYFQVQWFSYSVHAGSLLFFLYPSKIHKQMMCSYNAWWLISVEKTKQNQQPKIMRLHTRTQTYNPNKYQLVWLLLTVKDKVKNNLCFNL